MDHLTDFRKGERMSTEVRVRFAETDAMGVVWHGNYFQYFEIGRVEWLRTVQWLDRLQTQKLRMAAVGATVDYHRPALFDDLLTVTTALEQASKVRFRFRHEVLRRDEVLVTGTVDVVCLDEEGRVTRIPEELLF